MKRENLNKTEAQKLRDFVTGCVMGNVLFPATQVGGRGTTVQELLHERTPKSLGDFADFLEKHGGITRADRINGVKEKTLSGSTLTYGDAIEAIDLIIKHKLAEEQRELKAKKLIELKSKLDDMKTPKEKRADLEKEFAALSKELA